MKRWRTETWGGGLLLAVWLSYLLAGSWLAQRVAARWGDAIIRATQGNVTEAAGFVQYRLRDAGLLLSAALLAWMVHSILVKVVMRPAWGRDARWIFHAAVGLVLVNAWLAVAGHTGLFWCAMWQGKTSTLNLTRFQTKYRLARECPAPRKGLIEGSSQARAQMDEQSLNELLDSKLHIADLNFPGARGYDAWLIHRDLDKTAGQIILYYVSELTFYAGASTEAVPFFFGFSELPDAWQRSTHAYVSPRMLGYGLLSDLLPGFYLRDVLTQRILGAGVASIRQRQIDANATNNLDARAIQWVKDFHLDTESAFQKQAFEDFTANCAKRGQQLVLLGGQLNPLVGHRLDPAMRADMIAFLHQLRDRHPNVILIEDLPAQTVEDYLDLTHVNERQQRVFTRFVAQRLQAILPSQAAPPPDASAGSLRE